MSAPKKDAPVTPEEIKVDPLKENELGQVEGGFSEFDELKSDAGSEINGISCQVTNQSQCG